MRVVALALATSFGVGYAPVAPGTFGSMAGLLLWYAVPESSTVQLAVIAVLFALGSWSANVAERHFARTDPGPVVIDEVMGMLITLVLNPVGWLGAGAGFFWFRLFDVIKPYPASRLERLHGGVGVMADDAMAAVYANVALRVTLIVAARCGWSL
jgi:phosphatidylglycerophosphatase A